MSNSASNLQERLAETRAAASAEMTVRLLVEAVGEPSTKRFVKSRAARIERWQQLAEVASEQASNLTALAKTPTTCKSKRSATAAISSILIPATNSPIVMES